MAKGVPLMGRDPDGKAKMINVDENGNVKVRLSGTEENVKQFVDVKSFGAKGDGVTDDTLAFRDAEDALPENGGILFIPEGTYIVAHQVRKQGVTIRGAGQKATILKTRPNATQLVNDCPLRILADFCTVENLQIDGNIANNATLNDFDLGRWADGIGIYANNVKVRNCYIHSTIGHKIIVWMEQFNDIPKGRRSHIWIENNFIEGVGQRAAIDIASTGVPLSEEICRDVFITNNIIYNMGIVIHTGYDILIDGNICRDSGISVHTNSKRVTVVNNKVYRGTILVMLGDEILVTNNQVFDSTAIGMELRYCNNSTISGNKVYNSGLENIRVVTNENSGLNLTLKNNECLGVVDKNIHISAEGVGLTNFNCSGNTLEGGETGIHIAQPLIQSVVMDNIIRNTNLIAINSYNLDTVETSFIGNKAFDCVGGHFTFNGSSLTVMGNIAQSISSKGEGNVIDNNTVKATGKERGIDATDATECRIVNNRIIGDYQYGIVLTNALDAFVTLNQIKGPAVSVRNKPESAIVENNQIS